MPITEFLDGFNCDPETRRVMGVATRAAAARVKRSRRTLLPGGFGFDRESALFLFDENYLTVGRTDIFSGV